jgi:restriction endonuclease S subunit
MKSLEDYKRSVIWHVVTGKYEVLPDLTLRRRGEREMESSCSALIGKKPKAWKEFRLKARFRLESGSYNSTDADGDGDIPFYRATADNPCAVHSKFDFDFPCYILLPKDGGSPANMFGPEVAMGTSFLVNGKAAATSHCYAIIPTTGDPVWLHQQLVARKQDLNCKAIYTTGLGSLARRTVENFVVPTPEQKEKELILAFLEKFTSSLPDPAPLIAAKEAFKKSLIWHVVTGKYEVLDNGKLRKRNAGEMKESGVEWIGRIPKEWGTRRVKELGTMVNGEASPEAEGEIDVFGSNGSFRKTDRTNFPKGTIIVGRKGSAGSVFLAEKDCWITDTAIAIVSKTPEWCSLSLGLAPLHMLTPTTTLPSLTMGDMGRAILPYPSQEEGAKILKLVKSL